MYSSFCIELVSLFTKRVRKKVALSAIRRQGMSKMERVGGLAEKYLSRNHGILTWYNRMIIKRQSDHRKFCHC